MAPYVDHGLLRSIVRAFALPEDMVGNRIETIANLRRKGGEGGLVAVSCAGDQIAVQRRPRLQWLGSAARRLSWQIIGPNPVIAQG